MLYPQPILLPVVNNGSIFKVYANSQLTKVANKTILATSLISQSWMSCCLSHHHHTISQHEGNGRLAHVGLYRCNIPTNPTSYGRRHFRLQSYSTNPLSRLFCAWLNILVLGCQFRLDLYAVYEAKKDNSSDFVIFSGWVTHVPSKQPVFLVPRTRAILSLWPRPLLYLRQRFAQHSNFPSQQPRSIMCTDVANLVSGANFLW